jgi:hypothetical protein
MRPCIVCGQAFRPRGGFRTCSAVCSEKLQRENELKYRKISAARRKQRYENDETYRAMVKEKRAARRRQRTERRETTRHEMPSPRTVAIAAQCRRQNLALQERKRLARDLLIHDPRQSNGLVSWAVGVSAPTIRFLRQGLERRGELELVVTRIDKLGREYPASRLPNRGRLAGAETLAARAIGRAVLKVGALRTLEIVLAQLPSAVDLATTPYCSVSTAHLALSFGSRAPNNMNPNHQAATQ